MRLKQFRKSLSLSQSQFADEIGIHQTQLSKIESGQNKPGADILLKICNRYQVDAGYSFKTQEVIINNHIEDNQSQDDIISESWYNDIVYAKIDNGTWIISQDPISGYMEITYAIACINHMESLAFAIENSLKK